MKAEQKTLAEIKDEVAKSYNYDSWEHFESVCTGHTIMQSLLEEAHAIHTRAALIAFRKECAEKAKMRVTDNFGQKKYYLTEKIDGTFAVDLSDRIVTVNKDSILNIDINQFIK